MTSVSENATRRSLTCFRPWLVGAAALLLAISLYFGWNWVIAAGLGGILLSVAPCLAMCALGLCVGRKK